MESDQKVILEFIKSKCEKRLNELFLMQLPETNLPKRPQLKASAKEFKELLCRAQTCMKSIDQLNNEIAASLDQFETLYQFSIEAISCLD